MSAEVLRPTRQTFRIGAVSRLTGVTTDLIRVWERRYAVVKPLRTDSGNRLYTQEDIARLALIKHLVDSGDTIGAVASLSLPELEKRLGTVGKKVDAKPMQRKTLRIAVVGHALTAHIARRRGELGELELVVGMHDAGCFKDRLERCEVDVVVVEIPYVISGTSNEVEQLINRAGASGAVVVYGFGSQRHVRRIRMLPVVTLRAPADVSDLKRACLSVLASGSYSEPGLQPRNSATSSSIQPRRYDDDKLARIATLSTTVECECPHHLADLVFSLVSFEQYSAACANRNEDDTAMHRYLHSAAAQARSQLETALARLVEFEGLEV